MNETFTFLAGIIGPVIRSLSTSSDVPNLQEFSFSTIKVATDNFSSENKLGEGGFGPVYKVKYLCPFQKTSQCSICRFYFV